MPLCWSRGCRGRRTQRQPAHDGAAGDDRHLGERARPQERHGGGHERHRAARHVRRQAPGHHPHGLRNHGDGRELEAVDPAGLREVDVARLEAEGDERDGGGDREPEPRGQPAADPGTVRADRDHELRARGPRQRLAQGHQVRERGLVQPVPPLHVRPAVVAQVRDGPAERRQPKAERHPQHLGDRPAIVLVLGCGDVTGHRCRSRHRDRMVPASRSASCRWPAPHRAWPPEPRRRPRMARKVCPRPGRLVL